MRVIVRKISNKKSKINSGELRDNLTSTATTLDKVFTHEQRNRTTRRYLFLLTERSILEPGLHRTYDNHLGYLLTVVVQYRIRRLRSSHSMRPAGRIAYCLSRCAELHYACPWLTSLVVVAIVYHSSTAHAASRHTQTAVHFMPYDGTRIDVYSMLYRTLAPRKIYIVHAWYNM